MNYNKLLACNIFSSLRVDELEAIFAQIEHAEQVFAKGDILAQQGERCNRLIILIEGSVKAEMSDPSGKVVKVEDITAPQALAVLFLFGSKNRFPVQVTAHEDSVAIVIHKESVLKMLMLNPVLLNNFLDVSANYASFLAEKLHIMSFRTIRQKIAMYVLNLAKESDHIELDRTQSSLAEYFGVSRPALARELANMQKEDLIVFDRKLISIKNRNKLVQLINF